MSKLFKLTCLLISIAFQLQGQDQQSIIDNYIENLNECALSKDGDANIEHIIDNLEYLYNNPLNLNNATYVELEKLIVLTDFQIYSLLDYRKKMGRIISIQELHYIYGFTDETVFLIHPFIYVGNKQKGNQGQYNNHAVKNTLLARFRTNNSPIENALGNNHSYYLRYNASITPALQLGLMAEKDAGEEFLKNSNRYGLDAYTGFLNYSSKGPVKELILGDYNCRLGQGLLLWTGYSGGKSSELTTIQKRGVGEKGNSSADEYNFLRGGLVKLNWNNFSLRLFASHKRIDATIDTNNNSILTVRTNGLHRTSTEISYRNTARETVIGSSFHYFSAHLSAGIVFLNGNYNLPVETQSSLYKSFQFSGNAYNGISVNYKAMFQFAQMFGEISYANSDYAFLSGMNLMPSSSILANITYRSYGLSYFSPYASPFSESSSYQGEEGLFMGLQWQTEWKIKFSAYADLFRYKWLQYQVNSPSNGNEIVFEIKYSLPSDALIGFRFKSQTKSKNQSVSDFSFAPADEKTQSYRISLNYSLSEKLKMNTRVVVSKVENADEEKRHGYLMYQDLILNTTKKSCLTFRYAWFDINDYKNRIYAYEYNPRFVYSMPAYNGRGTRMYIMLKYELTESLSIWGRYAYTEYFDQVHKNKKEGLIQFLLKF